MLKHFRFSHTLEELGSNSQIAIDLNIEFEYSPGCEPVYYLKNGDPGYPGEDDNLEPIECFVTRIYGWDTEANQTYDFKRYSHYPETFRWFQSLDQIALKYVEDNWEDNLIELARESAIDE